MASRLLLPGLLLASLFASSYADEGLVVVRMDRKIELSSPVVRVMTSFKVENEGSKEVSTVLLTIPPQQAPHLAFATVVAVSGKAKSRSFEYLDVTPLDDAAAAATGAPAGVAVQEVVLREPLVPGKSLLLESYLVFTGLLQAYPAEISQAEAQRMMFHDSHYVLCPYPVRVQQTTLKLPSPNLEYFTPLDPSRKQDAEVRLGPYENVAAFAVSPLDVHFENNNPFAVARSLTREIILSHWGNVYITEDYDVVHRGATHKGVFSRLELQSRPHASGVSSLKGMLAVLPRRARFVYYRDDIGNISTSNLRQDGRKSELEIAPRYPLFGGWSTTFQLGYSVPLPDIVFTATDGTRFLNTTFGTPFLELPIEHLIVKVVLPEGSYAIKHDVPFSLDSSYSETKFSYLDTVGRPTVVLEKRNVVPEHGNLFFQVKYSFPPVSLLAEPLLLVAAFATFFALCAVYVRLDLTIAKSSPAYQALLQQEEIVDATQRLTAAVAQRSALVELLEASLLRLGRSGDVAAAKAVRRQVEEQLKDSNKEVLSSLARLETLGKPPKVLPTAEALVKGDKERVDKVLQKHSVTVEGYEKSLPAKEIDARIAPIQEKLVAAKAEVKRILLAMED